MKPLIDPINTSDGQFHGRNNQTGELATIVTPVYMNDTQDATRSLQREVISVLTAGGIKPADATNDQLLDALKALFLAEDDTRVSGALQKDKNLSDLPDATKAREALELDQVGNWLAVQANGGLHSSGNHRIYLDWGEDGNSTSRLTPVISASWLRRTSCSMPPYLFHGPLIHHRLVTPSCRDRPSTRQNIPSLPPLILREPCLTCVARRLKASQTAASC